MLKRVSSADGSVQNVVSCHLTNVNRVIILSTVMELNYTVQVHVMELRLPATIHGQDLFNMIRHILPSLSLKNTPMLNHDISYSLEESPAKNGVGKEWKSPTAYPMEPVCRRGRLPVTTPHIGSPDLHTHLGVSLSPGADSII